MSSASRGSLRRKNDYYVTPVEDIENFLSEFLKHEDISIEQSILDCAAGGDEINDMSYPLALSAFGFNNIETIDIRADSRANIIDDYLSIDLTYTPHIIITNPPFSLSEEFIKKALNDVEDGGFVIMLLRLNYFGSQRRKPLWDSHMPKYTFVHHKRISFTDDGKTDSIEYAHFVWQKGYYPEFTQLKVI